MEILKRPEVFKMQGTNILAAFDSIGYRMDVLGGSFIFAAHPLASIKMPFVLIVTVFFQTAGPLTEKVFSIKEHKFYLIKLYQLMLKMAQALFGNCLVNP